MHLAVIVVSIKGDTYVLFSLFVDFNIVSFFQSCDEVGCVFFASIFDPKIINY